MTVDQARDEGVDGDAVYQWTVTTEGVDSANMGHHLIRVEEFTIYAFDIGPITAANIDQIEPVGPSPFAEFH